MLINQEIQRALAHAAGIALSHIESSDAYAIDSACGKGIAYHVSRRNDNGNTPDFWVLADKIGNFFSYSLGVVGREVPFLDTPSAAGFFEIIHECP